MKNPMTKLLACVEVASLVAAAAGEYQSMKKAQVIPQSQSAVGRVVGVEMRSIRARLRRAMDDFETAVARRRSNTQQN